MTTEQRTRAQHAKQDGPWALRATDLMLRVGADVVFRDVHFEVPAGGVMAVVGGSGSGKTCLLLALAGRMRLSEGVIDVGSHRLHAPKSTQAELRAVRGAVAVGRIADLVGLDPELTLHRNISDAADWVDVRRTTALDHLEEWWDRLGFEVEPRARLSELPAIERTAAHLVLATLAEPEVIVLDDVARNLQHSERLRMWEIIREVAASGPIVIGATLDELTIDADVVVRLSRVRSRHAADDGPAVSADEAAASPPEEPPTAPSTPLPSATDEEER